ncbi:porin, partial [Cribrihabitans sp. XS_ASV171]
DSPSFGGFSVATSVGKQVLSTVADTIDSDIALRYSHEGAHFKLEAQGSYIWVDRRAGGRNNRTAIASVSAEHKPSGLILSVSTGTRDIAGSYHYVKLSYDPVIPRIGPLSVSVDYYSGRDMVSVGSRSEAWGVGLIQSYEKLKLESYLGVRHYAYEDSSVFDYQNAVSVLLGARWRF